MRKLYVCYTYYHLLISLIKTMLDADSKSTIFVISTSPNNTVADDKRIFDNIKKHKICENLIIGDKYYEIIENAARNRYIDMIPSLPYILAKPFKIWRDIRIRNITCDMAKNFVINFTKFDEIYLYNDRPIVGQILNINKIKYHLVEDSFDAFHVNKNRWKWHKHTFKRWYRRKFLYLYSNGTGGGIADIEVNNKTGLEKLNRPLIELPRKELFARLSKEQKDILCDIFSVKIECDLSDVKLLILTQPLAIDACLPSTDVQLKLYQYLIDKYNTQNGSVVIKVHPRDDTDYSSLKGNISVLDEPFPMEILNFMDGLHFQTAVTVSSTAIYMLENCDNKISLGWEFLDEFNKNKI